MKPPKLFRRSKGKSPPGSAAGILSPSHAGNNNSGGGFGSSGAGSGKKAGMRLGKPQLRKRARKDRAAFPVASPGSGPGVPPGGRGTALEVDKENKARAPRSAPFVHVPADGESAPADAAGAYEDADFGSALYGRHIYVLLLVFVVLAAVAEGGPNSTLTSGSRVCSEDDDNGKDVYESRMDWQNHEDKEYIKVVQEALSFASRLKDNPHQFVITEDDGDNNVPVIDLSLNDEIVAQDLFDAASKWGFFQVTNHGLGQNLIDEMFDVNRRFMALNDTIKATYKFDRKAICGYEKATQVHPSSGIPDIKENFLMAARKGAMNDFWPMEMPDFELKTKQFIKESHQLGTRLLHLLEMKLGMAQGQITDYNTLWGDESKCVLRLLHYPATDGVIGYKNQNQWRAAPHTDFALLTLLFQKVGEEGLQCAQRHHTKEVTESHPLGWQPVPPLDGAITVNIGDMLQRWSSDKLVSNLHRVVMPTGEDAKKSRYSMAFFLQPDDSTIIESEKYETVTALQMIQGRVRAYWPTAEEDRGETMENTGKGN